MLWLFLLGLVFAPTATIQTMIDPGFDRDTFVSNGVLKAYYAGEWYTVGNAPVFVWVEKQDGTIDVCYTFTNPEGNFTADLSAYSSIARTLYFLFCSPNQDITADDNSACYPEGWSGGAPSACSGGLASPAGDVVLVAEDGTVYEDWYNWGYLSSRFVTVTPNNALDDPGDSTPFMGLILVGALVGAMAIAQNPSLLGWFSFSYFIRKNTPPGWYNRAGTRSSESAMIGLVEDGSNKHITGQYVAPEILKTSEEFHELELEARKAAAKYHLQDAQAEQAAEHAAKNADSNEAVNQANTLGVDMEHGNVDQGVSQSVTEADMLAQAHHDIDIDHSTNHGVMASIYEGIATVADIISKPAEWLTMAYMKVLDITEPPEIKDTDSLSLKFKTFIAQAFYRITAGILGLDLLREMNNITTEKVLNKAAEGAKELGMNVAKLASVLNLKQYDTNGDGKLDENEIKNIKDPKAQVLIQYYLKKYLNRKEELNLEEYEALLEKSFGEVSVYLLNINTLNHLIDETKVSPDGKVKISEDLASLLNQLLPAGADKIKEGELLDKKKLEELQFMAIKNGVMNLSEDAQFLFLLLFSDESGNELLLNSLNWTSDSGSSSQTKVYHSRFAQPIIDLFRSYEDAEDKLYEKLGNLYAITHFFATNSGTLTGKVDLDDLHNIGLSTETARPLLINALVHKAKAVGWDKLSHEEKEIFRELYKASDGSSVSEKDIKYIIQNATFENIVSPMLERLSSLTEDLNSSSDQIRTTTANFLHKIDHLEIEKEYIPQFTFRLRDLSEVQQQAEWLVEHSHDLVYGMKGIADSILQDPFATKEEKIIAQQINAQINALSVAGVGDLNHLSLQSLAQLTFLNASLAILHKADVAGESHVMAGKGDWALDNSEVAFSTAKQLAHLLGPQFVKSLQAMEEVYKDTEKLADLKQAQRDHNAQAFINALHQLGFDEQAQALEERFHQLEEKYGKYENLDTSERAKFWEEFTKSEEYQQTQKAIRPTVLEIERKAYSVAGLALINQNNLRELALAYLNGQTEVPTKVLSGQVFNPIAFYAAANKSLSYQITPDSAYLSLSPSEVHQLQSLYTNILKAKEQILVAKEQLREDPNNEEAQRALKKAEEDLAKAQHAFADTVYKIAQEDELDVHTLSTFYLPMGRMGYFKVNIDMSEPEDIIREVEDIKEIVNGWKRTQEDDVSSLDIGQIQQHLDKLPLSPEVKAQIIEDFKTGNIDDAIAKLEAETEQLQANISPTVMRLDIDRLDKTGKEETEGIIDRFNNSAFENAGELARGYISLAFSRDSTLAQPARAVAAFALGDMEKFANNVDPDVLPEDMKKAVEGIKIAQQLQDGNITYQELQEASKEYEALGNFSHSLDALLTTLTEQYANNQYVTQLVEQFTSGAITLNEFLTQLNHLEPEDAIKSQIQQINQGISDTQQDLMEEAQQQIIPASAYVALQVLDEEGINTEAGKALIRLLPNAVKDWIRENFNLNLDADYLPPEKVHNVREQILVQYRDEVSAGLSYMENQREETLSQLQSGVNNYQAFANVYNAVKDGRIDDALNYAESMDENLFGGKEKKEEVIKQLKELKEAEEKEENIADLQQKIMKELDEIAFSNSEITTVTSLTAPGVNSISAGAIIPKVADLPILVDGQPVMASSLFYWIAQQDMDTAKKLEKAYKEFLGLFTSGEMGNKIKNALEDPDSASALPLGMDKTYIKKYADEYQKTVERINQADFFSYIFTPDRLSEEQKTQIKELLKELGLDEEKLKEFANQYDQEGGDINEAIRERLSELIKNKIAHEAISSYMEEKGYSVSDEEKGLISFDFLKFAQDTGLIAKDEIPTDVNPEELKMASWLSQLSPLISHDARPEVDSLADSTHFLYDNLGGNARLGVSQHSRNLFGYVTDLEHAKREGAALPIHPSVPKLVTINNSHGLLDEVSIDTLREIGKYYDNLDITGFGWDAFGKSMLYLAAQEDVSKGAVITKESPLWEKLMEVLPDDYKQPSYLVVEVDKAKKKLEELDVKPGTIVVYGDEVYLKTASSPYSYEKLNHVDINLIQEMSLHIAASGLTEQEEKDLEKALVYYANNDREKYREIQEMLADDRISQSERERLEELIHPTYHIVNNPEEAKSGDLYIKDGVLYVKDEERGDWKVKANPQLIKEIQNIQTPQDVSLNDVMHTLEDMTYQGYLSHDLWGYTPLGKMIASLPIQFNKDSSKGGEKKDSTLDLVKAAYVLAKSGKGGKEMAQVWKLYNRKDALPPKERDIVEAYARAAILIAEERLKRMEIDPDFLTNPEKQKAAQERFMEYMQESSEFIISSTETAFEATLTQLAPISNIIGKKIGDASKKEELPPYPLSEAAKKLIKEEVISKLTDEKDRENALKALEASSTDPWALINLFDTLTEEDKKKFYFGLERVIFMLEVFKDTQLPLSKLGGSTGKGSGPHGPKMM